MQTNGLNVINLIKTRLNSAMLRTKLSTGGSPVATQQGLKKIDIVSASFFLFLLGLNHHYRFISGVLYIDVVSGTASQLMHSVV